MFEYQSVGAALENAIQGADFKVTDDSFSYEYGSISGIHRQIGVELPRQTIEFTCRVSAGAGWCWLNGDDEAFRCVVHPDGLNVSIHVEAWLVEAKIRKLDGFWIVWGIWEIEEVDPDE